MLLCKYATFNYLTAEQKPDFKDLYFEFAHIRGNLDNKTRH